MQHETIFNYFIFIFQFWNYMKSYLETKTACRLLQSILECNFKTILKTTANDTFNQQLPYKQQTRNISDYFLQNFDTLNLNLYFQPFCVNKKFCDLNVRWTNHSPQNNEYWFLFIKKSVIKLSIINSPRPSFASTSA